MKLPRRNFLHLASGAAALPAVSRFAWAQAYPARPVRLIAPRELRELIQRMRTHCGAPHGASMVNCSSSGSRSPSRRSPDT
jgi:hypothetical protein